VDPISSFMNLDLLAPLDWRFYGNPLSAWLIAFGIVVGGVGALLVAKRIVVSRLDRIAGRTPTALDDLVVDVLRRTRVYFLVALAVVGASYALVLPLPVRGAIRNVAVVALCLQAARWGNGIISFWVDRYTLQRLTTGAIDGATATTVTALGYVGRLVLWLVILLLALDNFGVNVTALIAGLGITGIAVALAVQNILGDLLGTLSIILDKPFVVGDFIVVDQYMGTVENVGLKTTRVRSISGEQIILPNGDLLKARIRNFKRLVERRVVFVTNVSYDTPADVVERIPGMLREIVTRQSPVRFDRSHFRGYGEAALELETVYYVLSDDYNRYMDIQQAINLAILRRFAAERIDFAFRTRTIITRTDGVMPSEMAAVLAASSEQGAKD
jgi:small-conductance mechanosensitive channel